jgi:hypothetical protein
MTQIKSKQPPISACNGLRTWSRRSYSRVITPCRYCTALSLVITVLADLPRYFGPSDCHLRRGPLGQLGRRDRAGGVGQRPHHHLCRSRRTGNARSSCWQRLQASRIDRLSALGASPICALGYSLHGGFNLVDFGSLSFAYNFECFLIFKFNGLVLGISREQFV